MEAEVARRKHRRRELQTEQERITQRRKWRGIEAVRLRALAVEPQRGLSCDCPEE